MWVCLSVFNHFVRLALKGLRCLNLRSFKERQTTNFGIILELNLKNESSKDQVFWEN